MVGTESGGCAGSVKEDYCAFLLTAFGVLTVGVLGGKTSCSLLAGVSQSNFFGVLANDFLVARKVSGLLYTLQYSSKVCY